jgi:AAHS family 3-hydroxyphenylpropionic acid transporter
MAQIPSLHRERQQIHLGQRAGMTLALCFCAAIIEGMDLQSMGIAAAGIGPEFHLSKAQLGNVLTASPLGLFFGAFAGGRMADLWGRRAALILSIVVFGAFQLATAWAVGYTSLLACRFLCGLGLGGAFPNLIALTAEASGGRNNILNVVVTAAGMPAGGAIAALIGFLGGSGSEWRAVFYVGGVAPLALAPVMAALLPESSLFQHARSLAASARPQMGAGARLGTRPRMGVLHTLFHRERVRQTVLLWLTLFGTALILHLLLNWMPNLMVSKGFSKPQAFLIQIAFNVGASLGSVLLAWRMQRRPSPLLLFGCYVGLAAVLLAVASVGPLFVPVAICITLAGAFLLSAQFIIYGLTPAYYETLTRGTGTGAAVSSSRLGSAAGPFFAGQLLGAGASTAQVLQSLLPITAVAAIAVSVLLLLPRQADLTPS